MAEGNGFTNKEILLELRDDMKALRADILRIDREGSIGTRSELIDHEDRIRPLESFTTKIKVFAGVASFILSACTAGTIALLVAHLS